MVGALTDGAQPATPFLKWAGGKRQLFDHIRALVPGTYGRYYEPFIGGGAVFFGLAPRRAVIGDVNSVLMKTYASLRGAASRRMLIDKLSELAKHHDSDAYRRVRDMAPTNMPDVGARMIYLNRTCFNGLYRENSAGKFNVPFGKHKNPTICDRETLEAAGAVLQSACADTDVRTGDFEQVCRDIQGGDFAYFDPPYMPLVRTSFTKYTGKDFGESDHRRLATFVRDLKRRGVHVLVSNSSAPLVRELYDGFTFHEVQARRAINRNTAGRGPVTEVLIQ